MQTDSLPAVGWIPLCDATPPPKDRLFQVLHFGDADGREHIIQTGTWDHYGPIGVPGSEGDHCKRQTITHWRLQQERSE
jgi:hypothetical protein